MKNLYPERYIVPFALFALFLTAVLARPLMPIDETRYMTVAWEMYLRQDWLAPLTLNFQPYHHKPPLLFWMINMFWSVFGVNRWSATLPIVLGAAANIYLVRALAKNIFPQMPEIPQRASLIMLGSMPFLILNTIIMFDLMLSAFVLGFFLCMFRFLQTRRILWMIATGLVLGFGVLTKGPVAYLYTLFPLFSAPLWLPENIKVRPGPWLGFCLSVIIISAIPVLLWLIPILQKSEGDFAFWLIWNQTAGRITGNFNSAHSRPFYFYLPLLPVLFLPWILFPDFYKNIKTFKSSISNNYGLRFLMIWFIPVFIAFSLISGKQPHYMIPLLPACIILTAWLLHSVPIKKILQTCVAMVCFFIVGQSVAALVFLKRYDLNPVASYVQAHPDHDWAFVKNYNGEIGFLARLKKPIENIEPQHMKKWFAGHPDGLAVIRFKKPEEVASYKAIMTMPYRGKNIGIFKWSSEGIHN